MRSFLKKKTYSENREENFEFHAVNIIIINIKCFDNRPWKRQKMKSDEDFKSVYQKSNLY